jgi:hypothetical protein
MNLANVADEIQHRMIHIFARDQEVGRRVPPVVDRLADGVRTRVTALATVVVSCSTRILTLGITSPSTVRTPPSTSSSNY